MKLIYKLILLSLLLTTQAFTKDDLEKTITKEFPISANGTTTLSNKYGKMDINIWEKNQVKITVNIRVEGRNDRKEQEILDAIEVDFSNGSDYVSAETDFSFKGWNSNNDVSYSVEYEVYMPATNALKASMQYGNLRLGKLKGRAEIEVKYGNFYLESIGNDSRIELEYSSSDCDIVEAQDLTCDVSYSRLHIYEAKNIVIDSKYSQGMEIERCNNLNIDSKYDRYTIGQAKDIELDTEYSNYTFGKIDNAVIEADYTNVKIEELNNSLDIDLSYNNCVVEKVKRGFSTIKIVGSYGNFKLGLEKDASYQLRAKGKYANIRYDDAGMDIKKDIQRTGSFEIEGSKGTANARSKIMAELSYGGLKIWEE